MRVAEGGRGRRRANAAEGGARTQAEATIAEEGGGGHCGRGRTRAAEGRRGGGEGRRAVEKRSRCGSELAFSEKPVQSHLSIRSVGPDYFAFAVRLSRLRSASFGGIIWLILLII
jgi:hypothetical protein